MADKIFDDEDIIDLTDLLEEGEPKKEKKVGSPARANEPDSFDLGKEISMEYEVSVEEIEQGHDDLDIDASLSSNEEVALAQEKEGGASAVEQTGEALFDDNRESAAEKADLSIDGSEPVLRKETEAGEVLAIIPEKGLGNPVEEPVSEPLPIIEDAAGLDVRKPVVEEPGEASSVLEGGGGLTGESALEPARNLAHTLMTEDVLAELRREIPAMIEGIVKPLVSELVKEMVAATRERLPGVVEKVIREEIEKLKKLDS